MTNKFATFLSQLSKTNITLGYFTDFNKVKNNISKIAIKLHQLNYLLGRYDLENAINELYIENPDVFTVLPILIAIRESKEVKIVDPILGVTPLSTYFSSPELILEYMNKTGLSEIFINKNINNLVDYVFGIEVGLDTNARKNRGGQVMSETISDIFDEAGISYEKEVSSINLYEITSLGINRKKFDFIIKTNIKTYLIEVNYYNRGGSKLNEVARSYKDIALKINKCPNYEFVWITDGSGWLDAKNTLEEVFNIIPSLYNLKSISNFINKIKSETN